MTTDQKVGGLNPFGITKQTMLRKEHFLFEERIMPSGMNPG